MFDSRASKRYGAVIRPLEPLVILASNSSSWRGDEINISKSKRSERASERESEISLSLALSERVCSLDLSRFVLVSLQLDPTGREDEKFVVRQGRAASRFGRLLIYYETRCERWSRRDVVAEVAHVSGLWAERTIARVATVEQKIVFKLILGFSLWCALSLSLSFALALEARHCGHANK